MSNEISVPSKPGYLTEVDRADYGTEGLAEFVSPPRLKLVQALSEEPLDKYDQGQPIVMPGEILLPAEFHATPVFFQVEYILWNSRKMKGTLPSIRERTLDGKSEIARFAKDPNRRTAPQPENTECQMNYQEHLNYILMIHGIPELSEQPVAVSFCRSEHKTGRHFASLIRMRRAPIYAGVYHFSVGDHKSPQGKWKGFEINNPGEVDPWVPEGMFNIFKELHGTMKTTEVRFDHEGTDEEALEPADSSAESF